MPTYHYLCDRCGIVDVLQSARDAALSMCPECGGNGFQRSQLPPEHLAALWQDAPLVPAKPHKNARKPTPSADPNAPQPQPQPQRKPLP